MVSSSRTRREDASSDAAGAASEWIDAARVLVHHELDAEEDFHVAWTGVENGRAVRMTTENGSDWEVEESTVRCWATRLVAELAAAARRARDSTGSEAVSLPVALALPTDLLISSGEAVLRGREDLLAELVRVPVMRAREAAAWAVVPEHRRAHLLRALHRQVRGHLRLTALDRTTAQQQTIGWLLYRDGWRDLTAGAPGISRLTRHRPAVLADRLVAALAGQP